ncbi:fumarate/nitrate reduction transcriptional regulator Fnr [Herminiimonas fonticola]|uniref:CRP/FNR family transcriptional regulator n=1 Tax=Herminiimonas fonticola TaxID=303380 RepID=A0A4R6G135_9BURK|nr:fumarate/nitrate reduction transcriptional regulator Fnr [Herminiimonas fonticola]RBA23630.1 cAMP-binding protein [Herminiimonas fonticola]TDN88036.1 CRP/FNR family transcriptional regulator [Herminiimonas fonticola]
MDFPPKSVTSTEVLGTQSRNCSVCSQHQLCLPTDLNECDTQRLDKIIGWRKIPRDGFLYRAGDPFTSLYAVRLGHFKSYQENLAGDRQITGFQMTGEMLGLDAINSAQHQCDVIALDDSEVCIIPFKTLEALIAQMPPLLHHFHRIMSQEITSEQKIINILGNMRAEQRFAAFLLNLSSHYAKRGYSPTQFQLRMSREDIGNYLGLTIESISRLISKMRNEGLIRVQQRNVEILDLPRLKKLAADIDTLNIKPF